MKKQKQLYVSPETTTLVVRFEGVVCGSYGSQGIEKSNDRDGDEEDYYFS